ncbi:MAG: 16S rRNA (cytidine(1402)-2'-O)-methyltransferase [Tractidigestivibacter sp.]|jgi:16S rRNA (cytidine1402-2'-O)-methyltransferase|uniref:16S rRNA (cytidine(1402)-2'-O)-methyltransferase n=1 Tax=Tractidigestivibacter sp. TaxID=2847320 RepID=UPI003D9047DE
MAEESSCPRPTEGLLSVVGTPIGNLSDASPRMVSTLGAADAVLCEDTRVTGKLLAALGVRAKRLERCDENVILSRVPVLVERLLAGEHLAFVSDAGMPGISDPGQRLVDAALDAGVRCEVVPGPSAVTCALVASGFSSEHFFFEGFLPRKRSQQIARLSELAAVPGALVLYESPKRVAKTLDAIAEALPERDVALVRELTKVHEEVVRARAADLARQIAERDEVRGECVIVISAPSEGELSARRRADATAGMPLDEAIAEGLASGESKSALAKRLSKQYGVPRSEAYEKVVAAGSEKTDEAGNL